MLLIFLLLTSFVCAHGVTREQLDIWSREQVTSPTDYTLAYNLGTALSEQKSLSRADYQFALCVEHARADKNTQMLEQGYFNWGSNSVRSGLDFEAQGDTSKHDEKKKSYKKAIIEFKRADEQYRNVLVQNKSNTRVQPARDLVKELKERVEAKLNSLKQENKSQDNQENSQDQQDKSGDQGQDSNSGAQDKSGNSGGQGESGQDNNSGSEDTMDPGSKGTDGTGTTGDSQDKPQDQQDKSGESGQDNKQDNGSESGSQDNMDPGSESGTTGDSGESLESPRELADDKRTEEESKSMGPGSKGTDGTGTRGEDERAERDEKLDQATDAGAGKPGLDDRAERDDSDESARDNRSGSHDDSNAGKAGVSGAQNSGASNKKLDMGTRRAFVMLDKLDQADSQLHKKLLKQKTARGRRQLSHYNQW